MISRTFTKVLPPLSWLQPGPQDFTKSYRHSQALICAIKLSVWIRGIGGSGHGPYTLLSWQMNGSKGRRISLPFRWLKGQTNQSTSSALLTPHVALSSRAPSVSSWKKANSRSALPFQPFAGTSPPRRARAPRVPPLRGSTVHPPDHPVRCDLLPASPA